MSGKFLSMIDDHFATDRYAVSTDSKTTSLQIVADEILLAIFLYQFSFFQTTRTASTGTIISASITHATGK